MTGGPLLAPRRAGVLCSVRDTPTKRLCDRCGARPHGCPRGTPADAKPDSRSYPQTRYGCPWRPGRRALSSGHTGPRARAGRCQVSCAVTPPPAQGRCGIRPRRAASCPSPTLAGRPQERGPVSLCPFHTLRTESGVREAVARPHLAAAAAAVCSFSGRASSLLQADATVLSPWTVTHASPPAPTLPVARPWDCASG